MFELYTGYHNKMIGKRVYFKAHNKYIPCICTNYYFKPRMYTLVPVDDIDSIPAENASQRRCYLSSKVYIYKED